MKKDKLKIDFRLKGPKLWSLLLGGSCSLCVCQAIWSSTMATVPYPERSISPAEAKESSVEKLDPFLQALVSAYMTNSQLRSKVEAQRAVDEQIAIAQGKFRPTINLNANTGKSRTENQTRGDDLSANAPARFRDRKTTSPSTAGINITQSLYNGGSDLAATESASNKALAGQYDFLNTEQTTLYNAVQAYMQVMYAQSAVEVNKANEKFLSESLDAVKVQVEVGEKTLTDQSAAEASLAQATSERVTAEATLQAAIANYETVIGTKPGLLVKPKAAEGLPKSREEIIEIAKNSNVGILKAIYTEKSAKSDIDAATGVLLPKVDLEGTAARSLQTNGTKSRQNDASARLKLTIPLYQGGGEWAAVRQQASAAAQARFDLEQARKQAVEDAIKIWAGWEAAKKKIDQFVAQVKAAERSRDGAALEAEVGERSYVEVLDAQQKLLTAQLSLLEAVRDEYTAQYQVLQVIGCLTAQYLHLPVEQYDIKGHYEEVQNKWVGG